MWNSYIKKFELNLHIKCLIKCFKWRNELVTKWHDEYLNEMDKLETKIDIIGARMKWMNE